MEALEEYGVMSCYMYFCFSLAPAESVSGLKIQPLKDDKKALRVSWDTPQLSSPEGPVSLYEVEYRDGEQGLSNKAHVPPDKSFFVIRGVENHNNYEVSNSNFVWLCLVFTTLVFLPGV